MVGAFTPQKLANTISRVLLFLESQLLNIYQWYIIIYRYTSLKLKSNFQPDGYQAEIWIYFGHLKLYWQKVKLESQMCSPPLLYPLSVLRKELHVFQSAMHKIFVLSLFYLSPHTKGVQSLNGCSCEVSLKTTIFPHFPCQPSSCHTWIHSRNS